MRLELTETEAKELRELLDGALGDLSMEIADTDNAEFRRGLDGRRADLKAVRDKLAA